MLALDTAKDHSAETTVADGQCAGPIGGRRGIPKQHGILRAGGCGNGQGNGIEGKSEKYIFHLDQALHFEFQPSAGTRSRLKTSNEGSIWQAKFCRSQN
jgi:hypothetical protein